MTTTAAVEAERERCQLLVAAALLEAADFNHNRERVRVLLRRLLQEVDCGTQPLPLDGGWQLPEEQQ